MIKTFACYVIIIAVGLVGLTIGRKCKFRPGLNKLRKGVDITKLDWTPLNQNDDDGFRLSVIAFTCKKPKDDSCVSSSDKRTTEDEYDIPDQATNMYINPTGTLSSSTDIYKSARDYQRTMSASASIDYGGGMFSASASYEKIENSIQKDENFVQESYVHVSVFNLDLNVPYRLPLSDDAKIYVDKLPSKIDDSNVKQFLDFYNKFGTHFCQTGKFGGSIRFVIETKQSYYETHTEDKVKAEVGGTVSGFTGSASFGYEASDTDKEFQKKSRKTISYFGGVTNLLINGNGLDKWQPTVKDQPMLFIGTLVPIYELIKNQTTQQELKLAYEIYLAKKQLESIAKQIKLLKLKFQYENILEKFDDFFGYVQNDAKKMQNTKMLRRKDVTELACTIKTAVKIACDAVPIYKAVISWNTGNQNEKQDPDPNTKKYFTHHCKTEINQLFGE